MIKLGARAKDRITGFEGVITARIEYLNGCVQYCIKPTKLQKDGQPIEGLYFDSQQVEQLAELDKRAAGIERYQTGGPSHRPPRTPDSPPRM